MKIKEWEIFKDIKKLYIKEEDGLIMNYIYTLLISFFLPFVSTAYFTFVIIFKPINYLVEYGKMLFNYFIKQNVIKSISKNLLEYQEKLVSKDIDYGLISKFDVDKKIELTVDVENTTLRMFILMFLSHYNSFNVTTNHDCTLIVCYENKRRSLGDIFLICRRYYPNCTIEEVLIILIELAEYKQIGCSRCSQINKFVFHTQSSVVDYNGEVEYNPYIKFKLLVDLYKNK